MSKKLQLKHKHELQALNVDFKSNSESLAKEMKFENIATIAGLVGLIAAIFWVFDPVGTEKSIGSIGISLSFIAMLFGGWSYFAPPSQSKTRSENIILNNIQKELQELGYDPHFVDDRAALINSENFLNVWDDKSYEEKPVVASKDIISELNKRNEKAARNISGSSKEVENKSDESGLGDRLKHTKTGLKYYFDNGSCTQGRVNLSVSGIIFHNGVDAFNYLGDEHGGPNDFEIGGKYSGLVMRVHENNTYTLLAHRDDKGLTVTNKVTASLDEKFELHIKRFDVVLWECFMPSPTTVFGQVTGKAILGRDAISPETDFTWMFKFPPSKDNISSRK